MIFLRIKLSAALVLGLGLIQIKAQTAITSTGGTATGNGGTVNYAIGQIAYTINIGTNGFLAQGVQQPYEISVLTGIEDANGITLDISVYPNPTTNFLMLQINDYDQPNLSYLLFDMSARLLETKAVESKQISIDFINLVPGTYILKVIDGSKEVKSFKIIKQ